MKSLNQAAIAVAVATLATVAGAQETHQLIGYLNLLDSDATVCAAHSADPAASMTQFGLSANEQQTLMSGDPAAIASMAGINVAELHKTQISNGHHTKPV